MYGEEWQAGCSHLRSGLKDDSAGASKSRGKGGWNPGYGGGGGWKSGAKGDMLSTLMQMLGGQGKGGYQGGYQQKAKTFKLDKSGGELGEFVGTVNSFADKTWYGFI